MKAVDGCMLRKDAAKHLGVNLEILRDIVKAGKIKEIPVGARTMLCEKSVDDYRKVLEERRSIRAVWEKQGDVI
jgi:predicted site-specific integrase-resolvase